MRRALAFLLAFLPFSALAVVDTTSTTDPGLVDSTYAWVGRVNGCSAVAIGARTILTAGHVGNGDFTLGDTTYKMTSGLSAPKVSGTSVDLRVIQLATNLPGWYDLGTTATKGSQITMVGYGGAGVVNVKGTGYNLQTGGVRRAGSNRVTAHKSYSGRGPSITSMLDSAGESVIAGGDSGGGWFIGNRLVGISSFVFTNNSGKANYGWAKNAYFGSGAIDLTNAKVAAWVKSQILTPPPPPAGVRPVPEPSAWAALTLGCLGVLKRRRTA